MSRDKARIPEVLKALRAYWKKNPDLRLAQIVCNAHAISDPYGQRDPFFMEDDVFVARLKYLEKRASSGKEEK